MPLESTMICLDNSDWMRNGDYPPSRLDSQQDAAGMLCNDRLNSNPENTVGVLAMAGQGVNMLVSPTEDVGKVLACFAKIKLGGKSDLITSIQIAQLALKHRKNKNGGQRIIAFIGSPIADSVENLAKVGKQLKKNNVALDLISIGETEENTSKLQELINSANTNDNSHYITVPAGVSPVNALMTSPIMYGAAMMGGGAGGNLNAGEGDNFDIYGGINPELDPELAMAIRVSTEEARAAEEARLKALQEQGGGGAVPSTVPEEEDDEEAMMRRALAMSMQDYAGTSSSQAQAPSSTMEVTEETSIGGEEMDEDEELQRALALSMQSSITPTASSSTNPINPDLVELLKNSDPNDPLVQAALAQLQQQQQQHKDKSNEDSKDNKASEDKDSDKGDKSRKRKSGDE